MGKTLPLKTVKAVYDSMSSPIIVFSAKTYVVAYYNHAAEKLLKKKQKADRKLSLKKFFSKEEFSTFPKTVKSKEAHTHAFSDTLMADIDFPKFFKKNYAVMTLKNVDSEKKLDDVSIEHLSLLNKQAELGGLASAVAHEVNNPLTTVKLCAETAEQLLKNSDVPEAVFEHFEIIEAAIERVALLTRQMACLSRQDTFSLRTTSLADTLNSILRLYQQKFIKHDIHTEFEIDATVFVQGDDRRIEQVIINILNNALYELNELQGRKELKIHLQCHSDSTVLSIWNNGEHIPKILQKKIFQAFYSDKPSDIGTGIGLTISEKIMRAHGGSIAVHSKENEGTKFEMRFPALQKTLKAA